jgi:hypothetical protein
MVFEYQNLVGCIVTCNTLTSVPDLDRMDPESIGLLDPDP